MTNVFPSLSDEGFMSDRSVLLKKLLTMFISSDENQSNLYTVNSYKYIVNEYEEGYETSAELKKSLTILYSKYYDTVTIDVTSTLLEDKSIYVYSISISAVNNGATFTLSSKIANGIITGEFNEQSTK